MIVEKGQVSEKFLMLKNIDSLVEYKFIYIFPYTYINIIHITSSHYMLKYSKQNANTFISTVNVQNAYPSSVYRFHSTI